MSDHDPLCPFSDTFGAPCMYCALITRVRADEVERRFGWVSREDARAWFLADLRAKVGALPERGISMTWDHPEGLALVRRAEVLALLDGGSDDQG